MTATTGFILEAGDLPNTHSLQFDRTVGLPNLVKAPQQARTFIRGLVKNARPYNITLRAMINENGVVNGIGINNNYRKVIVETNQIAANCGLLKVT